MSVCTVNLGRGKEISGKGEICAYSANKRLQGLKKQIGGSLMNITSPGLSVFHQCQWLISLFRHSISPAKQREREGEGMREGKRVDW